MAMLPHSYDGSQYRNHAIGCTDEYEHPGSCRIDDGQPRGSKTAYDLAAQLPVRDDEGDSDLISLVDIVVTGVEHSEWKHFHLEAYNPNADGEKVPWATIKALPDSATTLTSDEGEPYDALAPDAVLTADKVRKAVEMYLDDRLNRGMPLDEAAKMVDGSYTDVVVADSILQFALYGEEVYG